MILGLAPPFAPLSYDQREAQPLISQCLNAPKERSPVCPFSGRSLRVDQGRSRDWLIQIHPCAVAKRLVQDGASVVIVSNEEAAKELADETTGIRGGAAAIVKAESPPWSRETLEAFGRIDILVLSAGVM